LENHSSQCQFGLLIIALLAVCDIHFLPFFSSF
jgi:hypothetical protein